MVFLLGFALLGVAGLQHRLPTEEGAFVMAPSPGREARGMQGVEQVCSNEGAEWQDRGQEGPSSPGLSSNLREPVPKQRTHRTKSRSTCGSSQRKMLSSTAGRMHHLASEQCGAGRSGLGVCVLPTPFLGCSTAAGPAGAHEVLAKVVVARVQ